MRICVQLPIIRSSRFRFPQGSLVFRPRRKPPRAFQNYENSCPSFDTPLSAHLYPRRVLLAHQTPPPRTRSAPPAEQVQRGDPPPPPAADEQQRTRRLMNQRHTPLPSAEIVRQRQLEAQGVSLYSLFQPIVSVAHSRVVGHEALLRGSDSTRGELSPAEVFTKLKDTLSPAALNAICSRIHLETFSLQAREGWLFLNVAPNAIGDRKQVLRDFEHLISSSGIPPHQIVIEIIETRVRDEGLLAEAVGAFRQIGCLVAIDDFGAGESNFERIWRLRPDLVKIDRAMITEAAESPVVRRILPGLVSLLHEAGCLVVIEGIETERQALIALECDADFVQGFHFAQPSQELPSNEEVKQLFTRLTDELHRGAAERAAMDLDFFRCFTGGLEACMSALEDGAAFFDACSMFLAVAGVQRVYLLDETGAQIGDNAESIHRGNLDPRFTPCADTRGANWFRRPYFQRAVRVPGEVQISRPYLSIRDARSCVTMSIAFPIGNDLRVLCADLDYDLEPLPPANIRDSRVVFK